MAYRDNEYGHITQCHMPPYNVGRNPGATRVIDTHVRLHR